MGRGRSRQKQAQWSIQQEVAYPGAGAGRGQAVGEAGGTQGPCDQRSCTNIQQRGLGDWQKERTSVVILLCLCFTIMMMGMLIQCHLCPFLLGPTVRREHMQVNWQNPRASEQLTLIPGVLNT